MAVLSIQSHTVFGHVGNSAAVLPLQRQGIEVWPLPAAVLSFHNGHGRPAIRFTPGTEVRALVEAMAAQGKLAGCRALLTGWLGSADAAETVTGCRELVRAANPAALWLCDPVLGETGEGLYVPEDLARTIRDRLVPQADVITPNQFELEWITGQAIRDRASALAVLRAALALGPRIVVCTSVRRDDRPPGRLETLAATADGVWSATVPELSQQIYGAGDMFSALMLARLLRGDDAAAAMAFASAAVWGVLSASIKAGSMEPVIVAAQEEFVTPSRAAIVERLA
jgi:pyridoxine kinase